MLKTSFCPIDRSLSGVTSLGQTRPGSNANEGTPHFPNLKHYLNHPIRLFSAVS